MAYLDEAQVEIATVDYLRELGYEYIHRPQIAPDGETPDTGQRSQTGTVAVYGPTGTGPSWLALADWVSRDREHQPGQLARPACCSGCTVGVLREGKQGSVMSAGPQDLIPHREPFLFVDEVVEVGAERIVTCKRVDPGADFFRGHYPGQPVMPGVLLCECCFQAGALLIVHREGACDVSKSIPVVTRIQNARFKRLVRPGDTLNVEVTLDDTLDNAYFLTGKASVEGALAVRVTFACMLAEAGRS